MDTTYIDGTIIRSVTVGSDTTCKIIKRNHVRINKRTMN